MGDKIKVLFCPKCKSRDVKYVFEFKNLFGVIPNMKCGKCGFSSISFPILVVDKKNLIKNGRKRK